MRKFIYVFFLLSIVNCIMLTVNCMAQDVSKDKGKMEDIKEGTGYYYETIMKDTRANEPETTPKVTKRFEVDFRGIDLPNKYDLYKTYWHNTPISQGNSGTCWDFSTTSFYESEVYRLTKQKVKLSEMYTAYWEYVEKATRYIKERGNSAFSEGSEGNAVTRIYKTYGIVPLSAYIGKAHGEKFCNHATMFNEMNLYLQSLKRDNNWNEELAISTIKSILNNYLGVPPEEITIDGKKYTPKQYLKDVLKLNMDDYADIVSYMQEPFWEKVEYEVEDNWWHSKDYYNVPLADFAKAVSTAIREGYTIAIGGDISEPGFSREKQAGIIPSFDIPSAYIDDDAREMRFADKSTTDDHGLHLVGYYVKDGKDWYLLKDSGSGSRNNDENAKEFGYYFISQDYLKLKIMDITVNKEAVKDLLTKFKTN